MHSDDFWKLRHNAMVKLLTTAIYLVMLVWKIKPSRNIFPSLRILCLDLCLNHFNTHFENALVKNLNFIFSMSGLRVHYYGSFPCNYYQGQACMATFSSILLFLNASS